MRESLLFPLQLLIFVIPLRSFNEYADITERVTGRQVNRIYVPRSQILKKWEEVKDEAPYFILRVSPESLAHNFVGRSHNELLNPGEKYFQRESWEKVVEDSMKGPLTRSWHGPAIMVSRPGQHWARR